MTPGRVVVVGASLAGLSACEALRQLGYNGALTMIGEEPKAPYDRPPLSKSVLDGRKGLSDIVFRTRDHYLKLGIELRTGVRAESVDFNLRQVCTTEDTVSFDGLIIATGSLPRRLQHPMDMKGVFYLRTWNDCMRLKAAFSHCRRLAIVGGGFIGAEVASSARKLGIDVTIIDAQRIPFSNALGAEVAQRCVNLHQKHRVRFCGGSGVDEIIGTSVVEGVRLMNGSIIPADTVVVGIGVFPNTSWLTGSGLDLENGINCNEYCLTTFPGVFASGDVANWPNPKFERRMRVEHWSNAKAQGRLVARNMLSEERAMTPYDTVPYFWSDQYDAKLQCAGYPIGSEETKIVCEDDQYGRLVAIYRRDDRIVAVTTLNNPLHLSRYMKLIDNRASWTEALAYAKSIS